MFCQVLLYYLGQMYHWNILYVHFKYMSQIKRFLPDNVQFEKQGLWEKPKYGHFKFFLYVCGTFISFPMAWLVLCKVCNLIRNRNHNFSDFGTPHHVFLIKVHIEVFGRLKSIRNLHDSKIYMAFNKLMWRYKSVKKNFQAKGLWRPFHDSQWAHEL